MHRSENKLLCVQRVMNNAIVIHFKSPFIPIKCKYIKENFPIRLPNIDKAPKLLQIAKTIYFTTW